jgi:hypothetical protein
VAGRSEDQDPGYEVARMFDVLQVTNEQWDMMEAMIRKTTKSKKSKL